MIQNAVEWLVQMEDESGNTYTDAAKLFPDDTEFCGLLKGLAEDENQHHKLLKKAQRSLENTTETPLDPAYLHLDEKTKKKIRKPLLKFIEAIKKGTLTREETLDHIIRIEYSEWNDLFSYVLGSMKDTSADFIDVATKIQQHRRRIERFLENHIEYAHQLKKIKPLPTLWNENLLIVEDNDTVASMLHVILNEEGSVEMVANGKDALQKISRKFYAAIISDVEMPNMNGLDLYRAAIKKFPDIRERFIFFTGNEKHVSFFKKSGVKYLIKPASIDEIRSAVINAIESN